jgi:hypothetical protein
VLSRDELVVARGGVGEVTPPLPLGRRRGRRGGTGTRACMPMMTPAPQSEPEVEEAFRSSESCSPACATPARESSTAHLSNMRSD